MNRFKFVTVVWGTDFTDAFLKVCLPSQLFPGNLVHFARHTDSIYQIYTTAKDADIIQKSNAFRDLSAIMPVEIAEISGMSYVGKYQAMTQCHAHFIRSSRDDDCAFVFMSPDIVWADGAFARLLELAEIGKRLVAIGSVRLTKETFVPALLKQYCKDDTLQPFTPRQLVNLALRHLHPVTKSQFWDTKKKHSTHFGHLIWPVNNEGLIVRLFHLFPLLVKPVDKDAVPIRATDSDADYTFKACPNFDDVYVIQDSDEMCYMDFTGLRQLCELTNPNNPNFVQSTENVAKWANQNTYALHREFVKHKIRFHWDDCSEKWRGVEQESDTVVETILLLIEDSGYAPLSRMRYFSPKFLADRLRWLRPVGFLKEICSRLFLPIMRRIYGSNIRIRMVTNADAAFSKKNDAF